ncbi:P-loop NTPase fold protein [Mucilaginibacter jinjuensis]|uniref:P-loop NTPase fold protein n=1 Tax=Mucilaginibacter jinjuensis TaxID=1176721 RepID=A0ABY7TDU0_9SPHI|nr:P-loop NTPase fold protein [Mucilaginibacter jinjuensis]WCT13797.1 P-loop NTPase fold protein [Mucilaginibacter jinjuensis]
MTTPDLHYHQREAIAKIMEQIEHGNKRVAIAMVPGSGVSAVIIGLVSEYLKLKKDKELSNVLVLTQSTAEQQMMANTLQKTPFPWEIRLTYNSGRQENDEVTILPLKSITNISDPRAAAYLGGNLPELILITGIRPANPSLDKFLMRFEDAVQIAVTSMPESGERFGDPVFTYSLKTALKDGFSLKPYAVKRMELSLNDGSRLLPDFELWGADMAANRDYLSAAVKIFLEENREQKAIIYCPTVSFSKLIAEIINSRAGGRQYALTADSSLFPRQRQEALNIFKSNPERPLVLCLVNPVPDFGSLSLVRTVAIFRKIKSVGLLQDMLVPGLRPYQGKEQLQVLDFAGLEDLFRVLDENDVPATPEPEKIIPSDDYFRKADIRFRDKKNIEGVMGVGELAEELAEIIKIMPPEQGSMIGIFGKWGRGKTFLLEQTWEKLKADETFIKVDFHAWKYQDTPATWAYLYECISGVYFNPEENCKLLNWIIRARRIFFLNIKRKGIWPIFKFLAILSAGLFAAVLSKELSGLGRVQLQPYFSAFGLSVSVFTTLYALFTTAKKDYSAKAKDLFLKYSAKHSFKEHLGVQAEIQKETLTLLKCWIPKKLSGKRKIILFVEDIDRCSESKVIQIIDSLRVLLEDTEIAKRVIVVAAVDERMLKLAIRMKYHSLISVDKKEADHAAMLTKMTNEYIDKLFISGLKLGELSMADSDEFLIALTKPDRVDGALPALSELFIREREREYSRLSQRALHANMEWDIIDAETNYEDYDIYEEPDYATEYLENSEDEESISKSITERELSSANPDLNSLTNEEADILRVCITRYKGATPRQIRIFYYRYLIAKNLLIRHYKKLGRTSVWQKKSHSRILATLIVSYTIHEDEDIIVKHLAESVDSVLEQQSVQLMKDTVISRLDYQQLLRVLAIVIAY